MIRLKDIKLPAGHSGADMLDEIVRIACLDKIYPGNSYPDFSYEIVRRSIDARKKPDIYFVYTVKLLVSDKDEEHIIKSLNKLSSTPRVKKMADKIITEPERLYSIPECGDSVLDKPPVVIGAGPAGLFTALLLARKGFCPVVIERGQDVDERTKTVNDFWKTGKLDIRSNVQFGEGGAGAFSDGKLNTLTKDSGRNGFVLRTFYEHGASKDVTIDAKPHVGTDVLATVVRSIREEIISLGGTVRFNTQLTGIDITGGAVSSVTVQDLKTGDCEKIKTDICVLAIGHSARDTFEMLCGMGIRMSQKSFAVGFRAIHPQKLVNKWQYGVEDPTSLGLPPADYKVANAASNGRRVYSFCMCPGGYVVNASSEEGRTCVNGMSGSKRDGEFANSAIIAAIDPDDFIQDTVDKDHPLAGMYYQRRIEEECFMRGNGAIPAQRFADFENKTVSDELPGIEEGVRGSYKSADLRGIFSPSIDEAIIESMHKFGYTMKGFDDEATLLGIESRTSSPVRIERNSDLESDIKGLYPCGEGAGYAGGIVSAATDGIKVSEKIIENYRFERK